MIVEVKFNDKDQYDLAITHLYWFSLINVFDESIEDMVLKYEYSDDDEYNSLLDELHLELDKLGYIENKHYKINKV